MTTEDTSAPPAGKPRELVEEPADRSARFAAIGIAVLGAAVWATSLGGAFVLDDRSSIVENESIRRLWPLGPALAGESATTVGRPLLNLTFALNYAACGLERWCWHAVNVVIHVLAGLVLFGIARRTLLSPRLTEPVTRAATPLAFAIASLWTVHPLQTESVTYVCQRAESLAGLFTLLTLWSAIRGWNAAAVAWCLLGVLTKETAAVAPLLVLLHDRTFVSGSFRQALRNRPWMYAGLAATWIPLAVLVASSEGRRGSAGFDAGMTAWEYAARQPQNVLLYLRLAVWPHPLVLDRGVGATPDATTIVPALLFLSFFVGVAVWEMRRGPGTEFLAAAFLLLLAPTSSFVPLATQTAAEHRMYLALAPVVVAAVMMAHAAILLVLRIAPDRRPRVVALAMTLVLAALGARTVLRNADYRDSVRLWEDNVARTPRNVRAWMNLGTARAAAGSLSDGLAALDHAVGLDLKNPYARILRGNVRQAAGRPEDAIADYAVAAQSPHRAPQAFTNSALVHLQQGRSDAALADADRAVAADPDYAPAYRARAAVQRARGDWDAAWEDVRFSRRLGRPLGAEFIASLESESGRKE